MVFAPENVGTLRLQPVRPVGRVRGPPASTDIMSDESPAAGLDQHRPIAGAAATRDGNGDKRQKWSTANRRHTC